jgi:hypothetical protein
MFRKFILFFPLIVFSSAIFVGLAYYTNVSTKLTEEDKANFSKLGFKAKTQSTDFALQIKRIADLQRSIFAMAPLGAGIPIFESREPADLMRAGQGLCYDRSRAFDKGVKFLGFQSRHVYLLYKDNKSFIRAIATKGHSSHAVTEVLTSRGWMFVDSNTEWIPLTRNAQPVSADDVWKRIDEFDNPPLYLKDPWWAIRGLYSRGGHFYRPFIRFPELSWPDFMSWLIWG